MKNLLYRQAKILCCYCAAITEQNDILVLEQNKGIAGNLQTVS
jgi:hypothetical protein